LSHGNGRSVSEGWLFRERETDAPAFPKFWPRVRDPLSADMDAPARRAATSSLPRDSLANSHNIYMRPS
jgi:hypothetical protein